jgi:hypothetical protein
MGSVEGNFPVLVFLAYSGEVKESLLMPRLQASKLAKEYEAQGGEYENEAGSKNEPKKGAPQHKSEAKKKAETEDE